ncbi:RsmG family class I SAM-dependent methyltransferase [Ferrimicrobium sp.]|uniref:RsmG family class I SAM-dependent methyltransferase n=1 Tax=Ferrimicrobium sp. TaxID=2926050 RepID=UPI00260E9916|nr:RsmG family class I SAM-dependent methyltransferase [Ferrimicrobium sp.]
MMERLQQSILKAKTWGFIGGDIDLHLDHSRAFVDVLLSLELQDECGIDLGSGGGLPSLVVLSELPSVHMTLVEVMAKRARFLEEALTEAGFESRARVVMRRAEEIAHEQEHRQQYDFVIARSFASAATTAEVASGLLKLDGKVVVSEPPESSGERWSAEGLSRLGLRLEGVQRQRYGFAVLSKVQLCTDRYPRLAGKAWKQPLF